MASIAILCCDCLKKTYADKATAWQSGKSTKGQHMPNVTIKGAGLNDVPPRA